MINHALIWKKTINLRQISYEDFISEFYNLSNTLYMEKIDGLLGALIYKENKKPFFQLTGGMMISDLPVLYEYATHLKRIGVKEAILIGELVAQKFNTILPFNQSMSVVKTAYRRSEYKDLVHHYLVDVVSLNGKKFDFKQAISFLSKEFGKVGLPHIRMPKISYGNIDKFRTLYNKTKDRPGFDGIVVRDLGGKNYKVKFTGTIDLVIIGAGGVGLPAWQKNQISYLLTSFIDKDGLFRTSSKIGTGFEQKERISFFDYIKNSSLYEKDGNFFVKPKVVVEMKFFRHRITPTLTYRFTKGKYEVVGNRRSVMFSHPSFERLRPDKKANKYDCRLEQMPDF